MRTTVDIPDPLYREIKIRAASEGTTVREIILEGVAERLRTGRAAAKQDDRPRFPVIRSSRPGSLVIDNEAIYDLIDFP
jgi:hypothetical protein